MSPLELRVPGDKSIAHRAVLLATLATGESRVRGVPASADVASSVAVARAFGAGVEERGDELHVQGAGMTALRPPAAPLDCGNSGTTARLALGLAAALDGETTLDGDASLRRRPMARVADPLREAGARIEFIRQDGVLPVRVRGGTLAPIVHETDIASAQVKSALLIAAIAAGTDATVRAPASRDHTERMLRAMGVRVETRTEDTFEVVTVRAPHRLAPLDLAIPGDPSSAAFLIAAALLTDTPLVIREVGVNPGRTGFLDIVRRMGAAVEVRARGSTGGEPVADIAVDSGPLAATEVGGTDVPRAIDELPLLGVLAAHAQGRTVVRDAGELRTKESDRIATLCSNLRALGVDVEEMPDGFAVQGRDRPLRGRVRSFGDHRIAMAFAVLGLRAGSAIDVDDLDVARVSYPGFAAQIALLRTGMTTSGDPR